jgi:predicted nucleic acid-binding protein
MFWDTSAIVPLLLDQPASGEARDHARSGPGMVVWWGTSVECASAIARLEREQVLDVAATDVARGLLDDLAVAWYEVAPNDAVRGHARRLLLRHPLRAADALQLGAALVWAEDRPNAHRFCTLDDRLGVAARREGFALVDF